MPIRSSRRRLLVQGLACTLALPSVGRAQESGVSDNRILFGHTGILSGPLGVPVAAVLTGAQLAMAQVNAAGGIAGRRLDLVSLDDQLAPPKAVENVKTLLEERKVFGFLCNVGSGTTAATAPLLASSGAPLVGGYAVADSAREKVRGSAYFLRATSGRELQVLVQHLHTVGIDKLAITQLDNPGGVEVAALFATALGELGLKPMASVPLKLDGSNAAEVARTLAAAKAQAVLMYLAGTPAVELMKSCWAMNYVPGFYGLSIVPGEVTAKLLGEQMRGLVIAQVTPYPWAAAEPLTVEFRALADAAKVPVGYLTFEGFLNARLLIEALQRCGRELTRPRLHAALRALKTRLAGMPVDFSTGSVTGSRFVDLVQVHKGGRFVR